MTVIRQLRQQVSLTQHEMARRVGTSQSAIAAYESGSKSPTLHTVRRFARRLGLEPYIRFVPPLTREDRRSLAFHEVIADRLLESPKRIIASAKRNLYRLEKMHPHAGHLWDRWSKWLELPPSILAEKLVDPAEESRDLRQVSPFSAVLSAADRTRILKQFRQQEPA